jgi:putative ABC transport system ATP-binding protein
MTAPLIELRGIARVYGTGEAEVRALDGVDLIIPRGEFVAIMGPSGSGKSTAMNIIGCLDRPTCGNYLFNGVEVATLDQDQRALLRRHYLGLPRTDRVARAMSALAKVGLQGREGHDPSQLSGGQQQRVAIARALAGDPMVILADEPTGNLDSHRSHEIMQLLQALNRDEGITIVMVTHEEDIAAYARRLVVFTDGKIVHDATKDAA